MFNYQIFSDGGARGNPGPAACAFVVLNDSGAIIYKGSKFLGNTTNNYAEYQGVIIALTWLISSNDVDPSLRIQFKMDSELVVKQINGLYKVKEPTLKILNQQVKDLIKKTSQQIIFGNIQREKNKLADALVNKELDRQEVS